MGRTYLPPERRQDKTSSYTKANITFDLINAFGSVRNPTEAALLLQDLLTEKEVTNLSKRLRIAKEILKGTKQEEIVNELHCGFGMIAKVQRWIEDGGEGLRRVVSRLPERKRPPKFKVHTLPARLRVPQLLWDYMQQSISNMEDKETKKFLDKLGYKTVIDRSEQESLDQHYREQAFKKKVAKSKSKILRST